MAKLKAPLFSFDASGQIAKSLVFMKWKGIKDVRQHVIPANPNTAAQQTQRGYMTTAVGYWHAAGFTVKDFAAWDVLAGVAKTAMSGFNRFVKNVVEMLKLAKTYVQIKNLDTLSGDTQVTVYCDCGAVGKTVNVRYGTSKSSLISSEVMDDDADNSYSKAVVGLVNGVKYYFQCYITLPAPEDLNITGIKEETPA